MKISDSDLFEKDGIRDENYRLFMRESSAPSEDELPSRLNNELVGSRFRLAAFYTAASGLGYLISLALCAQCSFGLTDFSWEMAGRIHSMPDPWCALLCGAIFGVLPFFASLFLLNRFQHRYLLFRMAALPIGLPLLANVLMLSTGPVHDAKWYLSWFLAASFTPYILEGLFALRMRQRTFTSSVP